ncbi:MAG: hypothetical protein LW768_22430 [Rubrivivax sp.]|nr:hypothetical protein [Rubrivivax sp.]
MADASEAGHSFEPVFPDGKPIGATITVRGPESKAVRAVLRAQLSRAQMRELAARKAGRDGPEPATLEELTSDTLDLAVAHTISWSGFADGGAEMPATDANLRKVYTEHKWLRGQVLREGQELGNFVRSSSPSCSTTPAPSSGST